MIFHILLLQSSINVNQLRKKNILKHLKEENEFESLEDTLV